MNIEPLEKNLARLQGSERESLEEEILELKEAMKSKSLEGRIRQLEAEIEAIKKFLAEDGYNKKIAEVEKKIQELAKNDKIENLKGKVVLVDFWAEWCAPCRFIGKTVSELKEKYTDTLIVLKINTETKVGNELFTEYAKPFDVNAIPYLIVFGKDGRIYERLVGANPDKLIALVESALK